MNGWIDGCIDGWVDGWTDGRTDGCVFTFLIKILGLRSCFVIVFISAVGLTWIPSILFLDGAI